MIGLLLLLQVQSADIIVTGPRLVEAQAECAAGGCTPLRDAQASIALAEAQFRDGRYVDAKKLLASAITRNRDHAAEAPRAVAALYEAYATVTLHEGDQDEYRRAVRHQVDTLRDNLPAGDPSVIAATTAMGDMWVKLGNGRQAAAIYRSLEKDALDAGQQRAAMLAGMKVVWLATARSNKSEALRKLDQLEKRPLAADPGFRIALRVLRLRLAALDADDASVTALIGELGRSGDAKPLLVSAPPYDLDAVIAANSAARRFGGPDVVPMGLGSTSSIQWADIGFWIRPDGRTAEVEILRGSRSLGWAQPALDQIGARRYTASSAADAETSPLGSYRVERFTRKYKYIMQSGQLVYRRTAIGGFEVIDLTDAPAAPPS
ncbi:hypothetical protein SAMN06295912_103112 [Sphingomonas laterariae]|uniref:Tetratricopeptide repeat-containing protein n=1 Tax=Edaphosphingomonas laterariae TaxID=861865 RepID=A0A239CXS3_9SPHN|nr:hypothetical protein [Sphingomonas laterariae]SNS25035.1 hypothetical protein SAMN06295912_103112 [Sphingomonas laterariae]